MLKFGRNVEITGYAKVIESISSSSTANGNKADDKSNGEEEEKYFTSDLDWRAKGGRHNNQHPCEGTAYVGAIGIDGNIRWKREMWHIGGYTDARAVDKITEDKEFYSADCGRPKDNIITNGGPIVTFRSDNIVWDFRDLSVREIQPSTHTG
jgi:hypothetical protein